MFLDNVQSLVRTNEMLIATEWLAFLIHSLFFFYNNFLKLPSVYTEVFSE